jgi:hypothetical protein
VEAKEATAIKTKQKKPTALIRLLTTPVLCLEFRPVCTACVYGSIHQANTNHRRDHQPQANIPGQQFVLDAYTNSTRSYRYYKYCDLLTDQATGQIYSIFTKDRYAAELCDRMAVFFDIHPHWIITAHSSIPRYVRVDPENNYKSESFLRLMAKYSCWEVSSDLYHRCTCMYAF